MWRAPEGAQRVQGWRGVRPAGSHAERTTVDDRSHLLQNAPAVADLPPDALYRPATERARIAARSWVTSRVPEPRPELREGVDPRLSEIRRKQWEKRRRAG